MKTTNFLGKQISSNDVILALEKFDKDFRETFPKSHWVTYAIQNNEKLYPPKQIMRIITGLPNVGSGGKPVNAKFEELGFTIITIDDNPITPNEDIVQSEETDDSLSLEYDMENALTANLNLLENGFKLYEKDGTSGRQYDTKEVGRIDLLVIDSNNDFVVIELKAKEADRQVCGQIQAYMGWVTEKLAGNKKVRGIIIANDFSIRAIYAAKIVPNLYLKKYQISFRFLDV